MIPYIKVVIASHNRPNYIIPCVNSVKKSVEALPSGIEAEIEVSENSTTEECFSLISNYFNTEIKIIRRPNLAPLEHLETIIREIKAPFFVLFHDDDIMKENFLIDLFNIISKDESIGAVSGNALYVKKNKISKESFLNINENITYLDNAFQLLKSYFDFGSKSAPFPGYMYRTNFIQSLNLKEILICGKYSDVALLFELVSISKIAWTHNIVMYYRLHNQNDSNIISFYHYLKLFNYLRNKNLSFNFVDSLDKLRFTLWRHWFKNEQKSINKTLHQKRIQFIRNYLTKRFLFYSVNDKAFLKFKFLVNLKKFIDLK
jgi:GT2 family glycosyltransferase